MRWKSLLFGLILGFGLAGIWIYHVDFSEMLSYWEEVDFLYLSLAGFLYLGAYFLRGLRWRTMLKPVGEISAIESFVYLFTGNFMNYLVPIRAGEIARSVFLKRKHQMPISKTLSSVFVDKIFDTFGILIVLLMIPFLSITMNWKIWSFVGVLFVVFLIGISVMIGAAMFPKKIVKIFSSVISFLPSKLRRKIDETLHTFIDGIAVFHHHNGLLSLALLWTVLAVLCDGLFFWYVFKALNQSLPFLSVLFGYTLIFLSYILPQPPAQIGTNEGMMILIFAIGMGYNSEMVSAVMTISHLLTGLLLVGGGIIATSITGVSFLQLKQSFVEEKK